MSVTDLDADFVVGDTDDTEGAECELFEGEHVLTSGDEAEVVARE